MFPLIEHYPSVKRHSLSTGLSKTAVLGRSLTLRTKPLPSGKVSTILPNGEEFWCKDSVATRTTSSTAKFLWECTHFCLSCKKGRYSLLHLLQKISTRYCTCFHLRHENESSFLNRPGGKVTYDLSNNRWFSVRGSLSFGSLGTGVIGRPFMMLSTSHIKVTRLLSSVICSQSKACRIFRTVHNHLSEMPPNWDPYGGLKDHLMCFCNRELWIFSWFQSEIASHSSCSPLVKFILLSE